MKSLFSRPVARLSRLKYPQKFVLISLLFALPLAVVMVLLVEEQSTRIDNYGWKEKFGTEYLRPLQELMEDVQQHRRTATNYLLAGDTALESELSGLQAQIDQDFGALEVVDQKYGADLRSTEAFNALRQKWQELSPKALSLDAEASYNLHTQLIADIRALISLVGDTSFLILDPELDSYYMMDTVLLKLPEAHDLLAQTLDLGEGIVTRHVLTTDEKAQLLILSGLLKSNLDAMKTNVQVALNNNPAQNLKPLVEAPLQENIAVTEQFLQAINARIINAQTMDMEPAEFVASGNRALEASFKFYDAASPALETVIQGRIDRLTTRQYSIVAFALSGITLAFVVGLFVMRAISRPLSQLTEATQRLAAGDMGARVAVHTADEVGQVGLAFNDMAQQLQAVRASLEARNAQLQASAEVGHAAASILDPDQLLREVVNLIANRFEFHYVAVFTLDDSGEFAVRREATGAAGKALKEHRYQLEVGGKSMVGSAVAQRKPRIALDVGREAVLFADPLLPETRSEIALPLVVGERALGALDVQSMHKAAFDEASVAVLQGMADQVAVALSNAQSFEAVQATLQTTTRLYELSRALFAAASPREAYAAVTRESAVLAGLDHLSILMIAARNPDGEPIEYEVAAEWDAPGGTRIESGVRYSPEQFPLARLVDRETMLVVRDAGDPRVPAPTRQVLEQAGVKAAILIPLIIRGQYEGLIAAVARQSLAFSENDVRFMQSVAEQLSVVIGSLRSNEETRAALDRVALLNQRLSGEAWRGYLASRPDLSAESGRLEAAQTASRLTAPIVVRGEVLGALDLEDVDGNRQWTDDELSLLNAIAGEVALAIDNARLIEQTQRRAAREAQLNQIAEKIRRAANVEAILRVAAEELSQTLDTSHANARLGVPAAVAGHHNGGNGQ